MAREILRVQESKGMFYAIVEFAVVANVKRGYVSGARTVQLAMTGAQTWDREVSLGYSEQKQRGHYRQTDEFLCA